MNPAIDPEFSAAQAASPLALLPFARLPAAVTRLPGEYSLAAAESWGYVPHWVLLTNRRMIVHLAGGYLAAPYAEITSVKIEGDYRHVPTLLLGLRCGVAIGIAGGRKARAFSGQIATLIGTYAPSSAMRGPDDIGGGIARLEEIALLGLITDPEHRAAKGRLLSQLGGPRL